MHDPEHPDRPPEPPPAADDPAASTQPPAAGCPSPEQLEALIGGAMPNEEAHRLERHVIGCAVCTARLEALDPSEPSGPATDPEAVWGSSIACAVFGPATLSRKALLSLRGGLEAAGLWLAPLHERVPWAVTDTSSGKLTGDPVDATRLAAFVRQIREVLPPDSQVGAQIDAGRGLLDRYGPYGTVFDRTLEAAGQVQPGQVLVSAEVYERLEPLSVRMRRLPDGRGLVAAHAPSPRRLERWTSSLGQTLRGWWGGWSGGFEGAGLKVDVARGRRTATRLRGGGSSSGHAAATGQGPVQRLEAGDRVLIEYEAPAEGWLYLLLRREAGLSAWQDGRPVRRPGDPPLGTIPLELSPEPGLLRLFLLLTARPVTAWDQVLESLPPLPLTQDDVMVHLGDQLLADQSLESFLLLEAGAFEWRRSS